MSSGDGALQVEDDLGPERDEASRDAGGDEAAENGATQVRAPRNDPDRIAAFFGGTPRRTSSGATRVDFDSRHRPTDPRAVARGLASLASLSTSQLRMLRRPRQRGYSGRTPTRTPGSRRSTDGKQASSSSSGDPPPDEPPDVVPAAGRWSW